MLPILSTRRLHRANIALTVRWIAVAALMWGVGSVLTTPSTPMAPSPLFAAQPAAPAAGAAPMAVPSIDDLDDSHTLVLANLEKRNRETGSLSFALLRETELKRRPPPIFPEELAKLDGTKVSIFGFMTPFDSLLSMKTFMVMPVSTGCQFCAPPSPLEVILVRQKDAEKHPYLDEPIAVRGTLKLWKENSGDEMHTMFLYVIDDAEVLPVSKLEKKK